MKNLKKIVTIVLTVVMVCAFSTVVFAAGNLSNANTYAVKALPVDLTEGDTSVKVDFVVAQTGANATDLILDGSDSQPAMITIALTLDSKLSTSAGKITTPIAGATVSNIDCGDGYFYAKVNIKSAITLTSTTPVLSIDFDLSSAAVANDTYTISYDKSVDDLIIVDQVTGTQSGKFASNPDIVFTAKAAQAAEEEVDATVISQGKETVNGVNNSYWGVWVGRYSVSAGTKTLKKVVVTFDGDTRNKEYAKDGLSITGDGTVNFEVAILGVPDEFLNASKAVATLQ